MTKEDFIKFLEPFSSEIKIISEHGQDLSLKYIMDDEGEGFVIVMER